MVVDLLRFRLHRTLPADEYFWLKEAIGRTVGGSPYGCYTINRVPILIRGAIQARSARLSPMQPAVGKPGLRH